VCARSRGVDTKERAISAKGVCALILLDAKRGAMESSDAQASEQVM